MRLLKRSVLLQTKSTEKALLDRVITYSHTWLHLHWLFHRFWQAQLVTDAWTCTGNTTLLRPWHIDWHGLLGDISGHTRVDIWYWVVTVGSWTCSHGLIYRKITTNSTKKLWIKELQRSCKPETICFAQLDIFNIKIKYSA